MEAKPRLETIQPKSELIQENDIPVETWDVVFGETGTIFVNVVVILACVG